MTKEQFEDIKERLRIWREARNITQESQREVLIGNLHEELSEFARAKDDLEKIDAICDTAVLVFNSYDLTYELFKRQRYFIDSLFGLSVTREILNLYQYDSDMDNKFSLNDIVYSCFRFSNEYSFDFYQCMLECIKHIDSREQDTLQKEEWNKLRKQGLPIVEKWKKNKEQDKSTIYEPNYNSCRVVR